MKIYNPLLSHDTSKFVVDFENGSVYEYHVTDKAVANYILQNYRNKGKVVKILKKYKYRRLK